VGSQWGMARLMAVEFTPAQRLVAHEKKGLFVVKACPGSGKTLSVAARLARLLGRWRQRHSGVAALSFTNVAWQEIDLYLRRDFEVRTPLLYPHFLGTLDSFVNRFIFLPFGHLAMGCDSRPDLIGPPHNDREPTDGWLFWRASECNKYGCRLNDFSYDLEGHLHNLRPRSRFANCERGHDRCESLKRSVSRLGHATQADANYFAMKLLSEFPSLARALAIRFPVIMVDEAQDTSSIQMRILDSLIAAGLDEVMLIGDPCQAIYEWRQAEPRLLEERFTQWLSNSVILEDNWRSSQSICDVTARLAAGRVHMSARNTEVAGLSLVPRIIGYGALTELPAKLAEFEEYCLANGMTSEDISVLSRGSSFLNDIIPGSVAEGILPWREEDRLTRDVAYARYMLDQRHPKEALRRLEASLARHLTGRSDLRGADVLAFARSRGLDAWRGGLLSILCRLPRAEGTISQWIQKSQPIITTHKLTETCVLQIKRDAGGYRHSEATFAQVFEKMREPLTRRCIGTVHSAKGRSLDAVFLALKSKGTGPRFVSLLGGDLLGQEEMRIIYVAMTRARKALWVAVPRTDADAWGRFLLPG
jgi:DNA helicase II / ATP-dependent DNA helicase PcrA